ncbi:hypothetical protein J6590_001940 [Homalodisca vitripennis]|nr:hypothetical protein J6590_001940 [Homalodisca vitripennis]
MWRESCQKNPDQRCGSKRGISEVCRVTRQVRRGAVSWQGWANQPACQSPGTICKKRKLGTVFSIRKRRSIGLGAHRRREEGTDQLVLAIATSYQDTIRILVHLLITDTLSLGFRFMLDIIQPPYSPSSTLPSPTVRSSSFQTTTISDVGAKMTSVAFKTDAANCEVTHIRCGSEDRIMLPYKPKPELSQLVNIN